MSKRFNISSFIEGIIFIAVQLIAFGFIEMIYIISLFISDLPSDDYYEVLFGYLKEILIFSLALLSFYLSFFLFTKNRLIIKLIYKIKKNNLKRRLFYIVLLFNIIQLFGLLMPDIPSYPTGIDQNNFLSASLSVLIFLLRCMYDISIEIADFFNNYFLFLGVLVYLIVLPIFMPILIDILISYEPWVFIASLKQKTRDRICRICNSIPCTFMVWAILSLALSMPFISLVWLKNSAIGIECFISICISVLITFPAVITDGMEKAVNFIKRHYIKLLIPFFVLLEFKILYFDSIGYSMFFYGIIVGLLIMLTLYTPLKRRREENRAIRAEIKSELGI